MDLLKPIRELLSDPSKWTQDAFARVKPGGNVIGPNEANASCWCLVGAIRHVYHPVGTWVNPRGPEVLQGLYRRLQKRGEIATSLVSWNDWDGRKFEDVVELLQEPLVAREPASQSRRGVGELS